MKKSLIRIALIFALLLIALLGCTEKELQADIPDVSPAEPSNIKNVAVNEYVQTESNIYAVEHTTVKEEICNTDDRPLAVLLVEKIQISPYGFRKNSQKETNVYDKINEYLSAECEAFFHGSESSLHFKEGYYDAANYDAFVRCSGQKEELLKNPVTISLSFEICYGDDDILSLKENVIRYTGISLIRGTYGLTFNLQNGELLTLSDFVVCDIEQFHVIVKNLLLDQYQLYGGNESNGTDAFMCDLLSACETYTFGDYDFCYTDEGLILIFQAEGVPFAFWRDSLMIPCEGSFLKLRE